MCPRAIYRTTVNNGSIREYTHRVGGNRKSYNQSTNADQISIETVFSIAIFCQCADKWQSKILFLNIFDLHSSIVLAFSIAAYPVWYSTVLEDLDKTCRSRTILMRKIVIIFLSISLNLCFWCSKELSHWDSSFEYPQHMFWLRNMNYDFQLHPYLKAFVAGGNFCCLLISFSNSLDPDQVRQNVSRDLDPKGLTLW